MYVFVLSSVASKNMWHRHQVYHHRINLLNSSGCFFSWLHHSKVVGICDNSGSAGVADSGAITHFDLHLSGLILFHRAVFSHPVSCQNGLNFGDTPFDESFLVLFQDQKLWIDIDSFSRIMSDVSRWLFWPKLGHETDRVGIYYRFYRFWLNLVEHNRYTSHHFTLEKAADTLHVCVYHNAIC